MVSPISVSQTVHLGHTELDDLQEEITVWVLCLPEFDKRRYKCLVSHDPKKVNCQRCKIMMAAATKPKRERGPPTMEFIIRDRKYDKVYFTDGTGNNLDLSDLALQMSKEGEHIVYCDVEGLQFSYAHGSRAIFLQDECGHEVELDPKRYKIEAFTGTIKQIWQCPKCKTKIKYADKAKIFDHKLNCKKRFTKEDQDNLVKKLEERGPDYYRKKLGLRKKDMKNFIPPGMCEARGR